MINILFFAKYREILNLQSLQFPVSDTLAVSSLIEQLSAKGKPWELVFSEKNLMIAVNQHMCKADTLLKAGDEVAFFPPVTGG